MLSPTSIFRSRALLAALVISAMIALFGFSLFTAVFMSCSISEPVSVLRTPQTYLTEAQWIMRVSAMENHVQASKEAQTALEQYPGSETLWNLKGIHEIEARNFTQALSTLKKAKTYVVPTTGTMDNNLAWAGLWTNANSLSLQSQYTTALNFDSSDCNIIHTGMWVEFKRATEGTRVDRSRAIMRYRALRHKYEGCEYRADNRPANEFAYEVIGAGFLDKEIGRLSLGHSTVNARLLHVGMSKITKSANPVAICAEAAPLARSRARCEQTVRTSNSVTKRVYVR